MRSSGVGVRFGARKGTSMMSRSRCWFASVALACVVFLAPGCEKPAEPEAATPLSPEKAKLIPSSSKPVPAPTQDGAVVLSGISMTVPDGWLAEAIMPGPFAPQAAFRLPKVEGDAVDCTVRVSHYPGMKGMDDQNIARWVGEMWHADGTRFTRDEVTIVTTEMGHVRLKVVDMSGTMRAGVGRAGGGQRSFRMIAAIVDHPKGPHFVKVTGGAASMEKWAGEVDAFLKSARTN